MTEPWYGKRMGEHEITEFLTEQATGVLALSKDRRAYGIPMSFAYDEETDRAFMDLGFADESKKRAFLETTDEVCLTVYEWNSPHDWRSVVATGPMQQVDETDVHDDIKSWYYEVAKDIDVSGGSIELGWYVLDAEDVSGVALYE